MRVSRRVDGPCSIDGPPTLAIGVTGDSEAAGISSMTTALARPRPRFEPWWPSRLRTGAPGTGSPALRALGRTEESRQAAETVSRIRGALDPLVLAHRLDATFGDLDKAAALEELAGICLAPASLGWEKPGPTRPKTPQAVQPIGRSDDHQGAALTARPRPLSRAFPQARQACWAAGCPSSE